MYTSPIVPAIIPTSQVDLQAQLGKIASVPEVHIDVVDGVFVPSISWPYNSPEGSDLPQSYKHLFDRYTLEVDLMVQDPLPAARAWHEAGADMLVFHAETISNTAFTEFMATTNVTSGISALNDTPYEILRPFLIVADYVQIMGIAAIGSQGQPFDRRALERIALIRSEFPNLPISIDGSVNESTFAELTALKLERYIMGSAIMRAPSPLAAYEQFSASVV